MEARTVMETDRLLIRETVPEDAYVLFTEKQDEEYAYFDEYQKLQYGYYGYGMWTLVRKADGAIVGRAGVEYRSVDGEAVGELGYEVSEAYRKQGYAAEACRAILRYVVEEALFEQIGAVVQIDNLVSMHILELLGFERDRRVRIDGEACYFYKWKGNLIDIGSR